MQLTYIRLLVADFDACFRFYRDVMGFEVSWGTEGDNYADFKAGPGTNIAICERSMVTEAVGTSDLPFQAESQDKVALIFGVEDLDAAAQRVREHGVQFVTEPQDRPDWGIRTAHFRDPDGNLIEINSPLPHEEWTEELQQEATLYE